MNCECSSTVGNTNGLEQIREGCHERRGNMSPPFYILNSHADLFNCVTNFKS